MVNFGTVMIFFLGRFNIFTLIISGRYTLLVGGQSPADAGGAATATVGAWALRMSIAGSPIIGHPPLPSLTTNLLYSTIRTSPLNFRLTLREIQN